MLGEWSGAVGGVCGAISARAGWWRLYVVKNCDLRDLRLWTHSNFPWTFALMNCAHALNSYTIQNSDACMSNAYER